MLSQIRKTKQAKPPRVLIYGTEGIGKSTFAAAAPAPIFIQTEDGLGEIDATAFDLADCYDAVIEQLTYVRDAEHEYSTLCIDSLDWLEKLIWAEVCKRTGAKNILKVGKGFGEGHKLAADLWREIIHQYLTPIRDARNMAVVLTAHCKIERFEDPENPAYDRYSPRLHKDAAAVVCEWVDAVLFATRRIRTETEDAGFSRTRTTAHGLGDDRVIRCVGSPACVAKNRYGITGDLPLDWSAFLAGVAKS